MDNGENSIANKTYIFPGLYAAIKVACEAAVLCWGNVRMLTGSDDTWMMHFSDVLIASNLLKCGSFLDSLLSARWVITMSMYRDVFLMHQGIGEARSIKWHLIDVLPIIEQQVLISNCQFMLNTGFGKDKGEMIKLKLVLFCTIGKNFMP